MTTLLLFFDIALINSIALNNPNKTILLYVRFHFSGQKAFLPMECKCQRIPGL